MHILDNAAAIKKIDKENLLGSVQQLTLQLKQTRRDLKMIKIPPNYKNFNKIVINGMGGSRLGGRVAERLFSDDLKIPLIPIGSYDLPAFIDKHTLLILSSYSGNTEEILNSYKQAVLKKAKIMVIAQAGKLAEIAQKNHYPGYYNFIPRHNPCNQPRMSIGYQILATLMLLSKVGLLNIKDQEIDDLINWLPSVSGKYDQKIPLKENLAKQLAVKIHNRIAIFSAAEFLMGALHVVRNQINENAKQLALYFETPELNHHLLEGLAYPKNNVKNLYFVYLESNLYHPRNKKRIDITKKVFKMNKIPVFSFKMTGKSQLQQVFEFIQLGGFIGFYMAILNNLNPTPIPWVDYFKKEMGK